MSSAPLASSPGSIIRQVEDKIWLVSFMHYDLAFFDHETCRVTSAENPFAAKVSPVSAV